MKKQLLLGSALLLSISAFSQNKQKALFDGANTVEDKKYSNNFTRDNKGMTDAVSPTTAAKNIGPEEAPVSNPTNLSQNSTSSPILSSVFTRISGSMNAFGFLVSSSKPLNYNRYVEAVSFIQRKSASYVTAPVLPANAASGNIVAYIGKNDGANWDSTLLFSSATNWGRYPSGGLYNPPGNKDVNATYAIAMGPITQANTALGWVGSYYASKSVTATPKNTAGADQQFFANTAPYSSATSPTMVKHNFPRYGFNSTQTGIYVAGILNADINGTTNAAYGLRGAAINKGTFNSGVFVWTPDSLNPPTELRSDGSKILNGDPYMTWSENGQLGYVVFLGLRQGVTPGSPNRGIQPIIYKTTNGGTSWNLMNGIDFGDAQYNRIKGSIRSVNMYTNVEAPWFWGEGMDLTTDKDGNLHIFTTIIGHASSHVDSMNYLSTWTTEQYNWPMVNTARPYVIDFIGDGNTFTHKIIDSVGTQGPSSTSGEAGFNNNPWGSATAGESVSSDMRLQITRSYDGEFIGYSWAESDTTLTTGNLKWNEFPNIMTKAMRVCDKAVSVERYNVTNPPAGVNPKVRDKAYFHYMSSEMKAGASSATSATFAIPFTVSNNAATDGITPVDNYFAMSNLQFTFPSDPCGLAVTSGVASIAKNDASNSRIYPNPTKNSVNVAITLSQANVIAVDIYNAIGQLISSTKTNGNIGENTINASLNNANAGVYFVKVKAGSTESTKKLIVE